MVIAYVKVNRFLNRRTSTIVNLTRTNLRNLLQGEMMNQTLCIVGMHGVQNYEMFTRSFLFDIYSAF